MFVMIAATAACVHAGPVDSSPAAERYTARGQEPGWLVEIADYRINYSGDYGETRISVSRPDPRPSFNGRRYETQRLTVDITYTRCEDTMSGQGYEHQVLVTADGRTYRGCGGALLPGAALAGTSWRIVDIAGADVSQAEGYALSFEADRLSGRAGCNSFGGAYRLGPDGLQAGPLATTRMACPGARMEHERVVARILGERVHLSHPDGATLLMQAPSGTIRLRRVN